MQRIIDFLWGLVLAVWLVMVICMCVVLASCACPQPTGRPLPISKVSPCLIQLTADDRVMLDKDGRVVVKC